MRIAARLPRPVTATRRFAGWRPLAIQATLTAAAALAYFAVRHLSVRRVAVARADAGALFSVERTLHFDWEHGIQQAFLAHPPLVTLADWVYMYGHWPVLVTALVVLFVRRPDRFYLLRNALFISGGIGLVVFAVFPVVPPRLYMPQMVDTITAHSHAYRVLQPPALVDQYASMPSLHFGWNLLVGVVIWMSTGRRALRAFAVLMPAAMALAVIATANHFVLDVVAGAAVAMVGLSAAIALPRLVSTPEWARPPPHADGARRVIAPAR